MDADEFIALVAGCDTDGQVADWVRHNVNAQLDPASQLAFNDAVGNYGVDEANADLRARLELLSGVVGGYRNYPGSRIFSKCIKANIVYSPTYI